MERTVLGTFRPTYYVHEVRTVCKGWKDNVFIREMDYTRRNVKLSRIGRIFKDTNKKNGIRKKNNWPMKRKELK
jgi:hypothetical protein